MPSFQDSLVLFVIALLLFGPKKLPVLARELGKWIGEFRRASNEFKMQMEEELRAVEQSDRQKQIAAMEAAAPVAPALAEPAIVESEPERMPGRDGTYSDDDPDSSYDGLDDDGYDYSAPVAAEPVAEPIAEQVAETVPATPAETATPAEPLPIATSGDLNLMPPATGLPVARSSGRKAHGSAAKTSQQDDSSSLGGLFDSIPQVSPESAGSARIAETSEAATPIKAATESSPALTSSEALTESETHAG